MSLSSYDRCHAQWCNSTSLYIKAVNKAMKTHMSNTSTQPPEWQCFNISELAPNTLFSTYCYSILHQGAEHKYILHKWQYTTGHHFFTINNDWWSPLQLTQPDIHSFLSSFTQLIRLDAYKLYILFMSPFIHCMLLACKNSHCWIIFPQFLAAWTITDYMTSESAVTTLVYLHIPALNISG